MGNTKIRRLKKETSKWTDKSCKKHKHDFSIDCTVMLTYKDTRLSLYRAKKCKLCNSFINARYNEEQIYPILRFKSPHFAIGFSDIEFIEIWDVGV